ncbi:MAG: hypothetical protein HeimC2_43750 [Candidatus Heimdallarchaeota archaeon LC_2]|nr:MAG: hypothetical protein HeimC2_43750 [Candidatus Heimdallarchaeota archaeon LC_2]
MASIPDNLPPEGFDPFYKALIYLSIVYIIATAFTTWLITRKRAKPVIEYRDSDDSGHVEMPDSSTTQISFEDSRDILASLRIEIAGAEASLVQLSAVKNEGEVSNVAYKILHTRFSSDVTKLTAKMNEMLKVDIVSSKTGEIDSGITDDEMVDIEADLEKQLQELEDEDDFLAPRGRGRRGRKSKAKSAVTKTVITKPVEVKAPHEKVKVTNPPPPTKASIPPPTASPPPPEKPISQAPPPTKIGQAMPAPTKTSTAGIPPPPTKASIPPPTAKSVSSAAPPQAAQPMKVENADPEKEKIFAKSTSIAALRMDMLRELARLKKLINEDE